MNKSSSNLLHEFVAPNDDLQARRALQQALKELPMAEFDEHQKAAAWDNIAARLSSSKEQDSGSVKREHWLRAEEWMDVAAVVLLLITVVFFPLIQSSDDENDNSIVDQKYSQLQQWVARSQLLESELRELRQHSPVRVISGQQALAKDELERMIGIVDLQIAASQVAGKQVLDNDVLFNERTGLWQQRVLLLNELLSNQYGLTDYSYIDDASGNGTISQQI